MKKRGHPSAQAKTKLLGRGLIMPAVRNLAPWALSGMTLISLTAQAGESVHKLDESFRRSTMIEQVRLTMMPPRLSPLVMQDVTSRPSSQSHKILHGSGQSPIMPHIRKVNLSRQSAASSRASEELLFLDNADVLPSSTLNPTLTLERAGHLLLAHLSRFEGRTIDNHMRAHHTRTPLSSVDNPTLTRSRPEGSTPAASSATRLTSVTPAPLAPEIIIASSLNVPSFAHLDLATSPAGTTRASQSGYLALVDKDAMKREIKCLAEAVYFEARSEPEEGQAAVAQVVLNRVQSGLYPASICGVVYQNRHKYKACQFSFACEGRSLAITEQGPWQVAQRIAKAVLEGQTYLDGVGKATHYHANYVTPYWSRLLKKTDKIGQHIFYRLRPGQT